MQTSILKFLLVISLMILATPAAFAEQHAKVMVLDFQLNDLTDLPNAPEELARIAYLTATFKQNLLDKGIELIPVTDQLKAETSANTATYLFERVGHAAKLAQDSGADYLIIGVAMKPTYLFVYPRLRMVDIKTQQGVLSAYAQLESSWSDNNTTARTAEYLANKVNAMLNELANRKH